MDKQFLFLDYYTKEIEGKQFFCVYVLEFNSKKIFRVYKQYTTKLLEYLDNLNKFDNINDIITFNIKRDNSISLGINL